MEEDSLELYAISNKSRFFYENKALSYGHHNSDGGKYCGRC